MVFFESFQKVENGGGGQGWIEVGCTCVLFKRENEKILVFWVWGGEGELLGKKRNQKGQFQWSQLFDKIKELIIFQIFIKIQCF